MNLENRIFELDGNVFYQACPLCESKKIKKCLTTEDYTVSHKNFEVWECLQCTARFTQNIPSEENIGSYYKSEEYISHTNTNKGLINQLYQLVRNYTLKQKGNLIEKISGKNSGKILDIGCGTGDFLNEMKNRDWKIEGLEPDPDARKVALEKNGLNLNPSENLFELPEAEFDVVSMWHVLEHVHQLHPYLEKIHSLMKNDGWFLIAVPNYTSLDAALYQEKWAAYDVPRHLYHFSPESMKELLKRHSLEIKEYKTMPFDSFYVSMLSEKYLHGRVKMIPAFFNGLRSYFKSVSNPQKCSSVLYLIQKSAT